jgi:hypothetical protein
MGPMFIWKKWILSVDSRNLPACKHAQPALARTSIQTEEESCTTQRQPFVFLSHCSGVCCHPAVLECTTSENMGLECIPP